MTQRPIRIALAGVGKIARDQHVPALRADPGFEIAATASRNGSLEGVPAFHDIETLLREGPPLDAVSICTPPQARADAVARAFAAGLHVMLEKPPATTVAEAESFARQAATAGRTLFFTWHSREAAGVEPARDWLRGRELVSVRIIWRENIRVWHPGQEWILAAGGFGVFDPGINALSILTAILPGAWRVEAAELLIPQGRGSPIAATLSLKFGERSLADAEFDFRESDRETWTIEVVTTDGALRLSEGGARLWIDGDAQVIEGNGEYARLYRRFARLVETSDSDADLAPLRLVEEALSVGARLEVEAFRF